MVERCLCDFNMRTTATEVALTFTSVKIVPLNCQIRVLVVQVEFHLVVLFATVFANASEWTPTQYSIGDLSEFPLQDFHGKKCDSFSVSPIDLKQTQTNKTN